LVWAAVALAIYYLAVNLAYETPDLRKVKTGGLPVE
jgi:hypothetical protein